MSEQIEKIKSIKKKYEKTWLQLDGVVAVGIGKTSDGNLGVIVSVKKNGRKYGEQIADNIEGVPIEIQETCEIKAF